jgi:hypothetical protein
MKKNISSRFKIEYNDMYHNYIDSIHLNSNSNSNSNNNIVLMQTKLGKNISSSKLELLKKTYFIKEKLKKQKLLISKTKEENYITRYQNEEENGNIDIDLELPIINLSEDDYLLNLSIDNTNIKENIIDNNDLTIGIGIDIDNYNYFDDKECTIINLNETTVIFQDKIL